MVYFLPNTGDDQLNEYR